MNGRLTIVADERVQRPLCSGCVNGYLGADGVLCRLVNEVIWNEVTAAADCGAYESRERPEGARQ